MVIQVICGYSGTLFRDLGKDAGIGKAVHHHVGEDKPVGILTSCKVKNFYRLIDRTSKDGDLA